MIRNKKETRILLTLHLPPPVHGSSMMGQYIHDSKIINESFSTRYINLGTSNSVNEIGKNPLLKITRYLKILISFIYQIFKFKPDLIYLAITAQGIGFYKDLPLALIAKLFRKKIVLHYHNKGVKTRQNNFIDNNLYKLLFKGTKIILLSELLYEDVKKYVSEKDVYYCPNGIPVIASVKSDKKGNQIPELLFLSNLMQSKGVFELLEALKILKNKKINFNCNFVGGEGDISSQQFKQKVSELNLEDLITYHGKQFGYDKYKLYNKSDVFILPTHNECFPLVILEAMMFGLPVISTNEGAIAEIIDDNETGFLVNKRDNVDLANKIQLLVENPSLRKSMGEKGREKFEKKYTLFHFEQNMTEILRKISQ